ncbi:MAG: HD-GYP domain-containing protein [Chloroflexi bacterium]|nr:HD-GYP domain-containing protein [Chloroflexota bacterium]
MAARSATIWKILGIAALAAPMLLFAVLRFQPSLDPAWMAFDFHFYVVGLTAAAAALACAVVMASAKTLRETRLLFLGLAFLSIAGIFAVHGLATPGFLVEQYHGSVSVSAWLSAAVGAAFVAISVTGLPPRAEHFVERNGRLFFGITALAVFAYIALSVQMEAWLNWVPIENRNLQLTLGLGSLALTGYGAVRYYQSYAFARLPSQLAMMGALVLLMEVQTIILWGQVWHISWWLYHGLYGVAFAVLFAGWAVEVRRAGSLRAIADALSMRDALSQFNRGLEAPILELVDAIEIKDLQTLGHVRRVSGYALAIGRRLNLSTGELRSLVLAAEMHDVGKISIPGALLEKPGPLTEEEFDVIKTHTVRGDEIAQRVPALRSLAPAIRHHHERIDGSGYPDGLAGEAIPLISRIIAVADSYDAMTSKRPYRDSMSHLEAMGEILRLRDVELDPRCVDALVAVLSEPGPRAAAERIAA